MKRVLLNIELIEYYNTLPEKIKYYFFLGLIISILLSISGSNSSPSFHPNFSISFGGITTGYFGYSLSLCFLDSILSLLLSVSPYGSIVSIYDSVVSTYSSSSQFR